jgi:hypothetical protein
MLAHFSMANAAARIRANAGRPVLAAPDSAVLKLRSILTKSAATSVKETRDRMT